MINKNIFWPRVRRTDYCWFWTGHTNQGGYGVHGSMLAHRASWIITRGEIPENKKVLHVCDNRRCVNPNHLFLGTQKENIRDMMRKGRNVHRAGEKNHRAKLTAPEVEEIKHLRASGVQGASIAKQYGVTPSLICAITKGRVWKHTGQK